MSKPSTIIRLLPDGYSDKVSKLAAQVSDLDPCNMSASEYTEARARIIDGLLKLAAHG